MDRQDPELKARFKIVKETSRYLVDQLANGSDVFSTSFWKKRADAPRGHFEECFIRFHEKSAMTETEQEEYIRRCNYSLDMIYTRLTDKTLVAPASICSSRSSSRPHLAITLYVLTLRTCVELEQRIPGLASDPEWLRLFDGHVGGG
jgi:hypothetical protein